MSKNIVCLFGLLCCVAGAFAKDRVKLRDVEVLTLRKGEMTTGRRSRPVPQLKCTGGCHGDKFEVVQCYNKGWDGSDVQWECKAEMPTNYRFGKTEVTCEGYDYSDDEYILRGSCGLEYDIRDSQSSAYKSSYSSSTDGGFSIVGLLVLAAILFGAYTVYQSVIKSSASTATATGDVPPPYSQPQQPPPPYGFGAEYMPGYDSSSARGTYGSGFMPSSAGPSVFGSVPSAGPAGSSSGNFWTGAATGGILGYLFGRRNASYAPAATPFSSYTAAPSCSSSAPRTSTHVSTGYASTKRR